MRRHSVHRVLSQERPECGGGAAAALGALVIPLLRRANLARCCCWPASLLEAVYNAGRHYTF